VAVSAWGWTSLVVSVLVFMLVLGGLENAFTVVSEKLDETEGWSSWVRLEHMRSSPPKTGQSPELRTRAWLAERGDEKVRLGGPLLLVLLLTAFAVLYGWEMWRFVGRAREWEVAGGSAMSKRGLSVPPLPGTGTEGPRVWWTLVPYFVLAGMVNWGGMLVNVAAGSYGLIGRAVVWPASANLWSWPGALATLVVGETVGVCIGRGLACLLGLPALVLGLVLSYRAFRWVVFVSSLAAARGPAEVAPRTRVGPERGLVEIVEELRGLAGIGRPIRVLVAVRGSAGGCGSRIGSCQARSVERRFVESAFYFEPVPQLLLDHTARLAEARA